MPNANLSKKNRKITAEYVTDAAVKDAIDQINRRFQQIEARLDGVGQAKSDPCPSTTIVGPSAFKLVPNLQLPITTQGRPVFVGLQYAFEAIALSFKLFTSTTGIARMTYQIVRDGVSLGVEFLEINFAGPTASSISLPPSMIHRVDEAPPGLHNYSFEARCALANSQFIFAGVELIAYELGS